MDFSNLKPTPKLMKQIEDLNARLQSAFEDGEFDMLASDLLDDIGESVDFEDDDEMDSVMANKYISYVYSVRAALDELKKEFNSLK